MTIPTLCTVVLALACCGTAAAQTPSNPPPSIASVVTRFQVVRVTTRDLRVRKGMVIGVNDTTLDLDLGRRNEQIPVGSVLTIDVEGRDRTSGGVLRGALIGLGAGAALGVIGASSDCGGPGFPNFCSPGGFVRASTVIGAYGAGIGALVGLLHDAKHHGRREVWRAPGSTLSVQAGPIVAKDRIGGAVALRW